MKIATYNVWNESSNLELRKEQLIEEICKVDADVIGLQEVPSGLYWEVFVKELGYPFHVYEQYSGEDEGLAIFSKYPITGSCFLYTHEEHANSNALNVLLDVEGRKVSCTNVHLPWDSALQKEKQICAIDKYLHGQLDEAGFFVLMGDFNGGMGSSVHRYLVGDQSLNGCEANPYWNELATAYQAMSEEPIKPTLDVINNPRWFGWKSAYPPTVMDRIYIMEHRYEIDLEWVEIFGTEISPETYWAASDHYGVVAEVTFNE